MSKMEKVLVFLTLFTVSYVFAKSVEPLPIYEQVFQEREEYTLPPLPYNYSALEPFIDEETVKLHHSVQHAKYTKELNNVLKFWKNSSLDQKDLASKPLIEILKKVEDVPHRVRHHFKNVAGGYVSHILYWATMSPNPNGEDRQPGPLTAHIIKNTFENVERFRLWINNEALDLFGSGNLWICVDPKLPKHIILQSLANQDTPLSFGFLPVLLVDVWEHAYYLKYRNDREEYLNAWWKLVDWKAVETLVERWGVTQIHDEL